MKAQINLITIWTNDIEKMKCFYNQVLGFTIENDLGNYVEFKNEGVRFALCMRNVMEKYSDKYHNESVGQSFELAFPCDSPNDVDKTFRRLIDNGAISIHKPEDMPWNQRTALFADPEGNIHEIFAEIK